MRVINSHLGGGGGGSLAVNGKMPVAAWVPSLDTAGNGTTTLTDLIGSNDGTLTNMDAVTDWVADTDAGGVRALDFDGSNDYVQLDSLPASKSADFSGSLWFKTSGANQHLLSFSSGTVDRFAVSTSAGNVIVQLFNGTTTISKSGSYTNSVWNCVSWYWNSAGGAMTAWLNGVTLSGTSTLSMSATVFARIGSRSDGAVNTLGRLDDLRIFDQEIDVGDHNYLYNSGNGRGRTT